jgi:hypothetical protein
MNCTHNVSGLHAIRGRVITCICVLVHSRGKFASLLGKCVRLGKLAQTKLSARRYSQLILLYLQTKCVVSDDLHESQSCKQLNGMHEFSVHGHWNTCADIFAYCHEGRLTAHTQQVLKAALQSLDAFMNMCAFTGNESLASGS